MQSSFKSLALVVVVAACGPTSREEYGGGVDSGDGSCAATAEVCNDGQDNDCDQRVDCGDSDCSGRDGCPVCGSVENPEAQPLALPDGVNSGDMCSTDAQCTSAAAPYCVAKECHASYQSTLNFVGFPAGATLTDPNKLLKVCVNMEHSWLRDLQMELITPGGNVFILHKFVDRTGDEVYLGQPDDFDSDAVPVPGTGAEYCWTPTAPTTMLNTQPQLINGADTLPPGDYKSDAPWSALAGAPLNGTWEMRVTDLWEIDNGFLFSWSISFDPSLVSDCAGPIIL